VPNRSLTSLASWEPIIRSLRDARADIASTDTVAVTGHLSRSMSGTCVFQEPGFASVRFESGLLDPSSGSVTGMTQTLGRLPALEYLKVPYATWLDLVAADAVPPSLIACEIADAPGDLVPWMALTNSLLLGRGLDPVEVTRVSDSGVDTFIPTIADTRP
jgi:hypothetical protein